MLVVLLVFITRFFLSIYIEVLIDLNLEKTYFMPSRHSNF